MNITREELQDFVNNPKNEIALGQCVENALKFHQMFKNRGIKIWSGKADYYENDIFKRQLDHAWNVLPIVNQKGEIEIQVIDIVNYISNATSQYCNHIGKEWQIESVKEFLNIDANFKINPIPEL